MLPCYWKRNGSRSVAPVPTPLGVIDGTTHCPQGCQHLAALLAPTPAYPPWTQLHDQVEVAAVGAQPTQAHNVVMGACREGKGG